MRARWLSKLFTSKTETKRVERLIMAFRMLLFCSVWRRDGNGNSFLCFRFNCVSHKSENRKSRVNGKKCGASSFLTFRGDRKISTRGMFSRIQLQDSLSATFWGSDGGVISKLITGLGVVNVSTFSKGWTNKWWLWWLHFTVHATWLIIAAAINRLIERISVSEWFLLSFYSILDGRLREVLLDDEWLRSGNLTGFINFHARSNSRWLLESFISL